MFFKNFLISYLVQLLGITFDKRLNFTIEFIYFLISTFSIHRSLTLNFTVSVFIKNRLRREGGSKV